jgi:hypothetical protein
MCVAGALGGEGKYATTTHTIYTAITLRGVGQRLTRQRAAVR